jgi:competence protein ComEC
VVWEGIAAGILAWGATAGISASVFGPVPLAGVLVNMVAIPVFAVLLPLASLAALPALLGLPGGGYVAGAMEWLFLWWEKGADGAATLLSGSLAWSWLLGGGAVFLVTALVLESCGIGRGRTCLIATILSGSVLVFSGA